MMINQILTVAALSAPRWSFSSLWNSLWALQWAAVLSALILTVGAVAEYWEKLKALTLLIGKWVLRKSTPFDRCVLKKMLIHSAGPILVVLGIAGDFVFEGRAFILEDRQEEQAQRIVGSLQQQADAVSKEEYGLKTKLNFANRESEALQKRLDSTSAELSVLEKDVHAQGPRARLLIGVAPELAKKLAPFAGQRVELFVCGQQGLVDQETLDTWGAIANILGPDTVSGVKGAQWKEVPTNLNWAGNCGASRGLGQGVGVMVSDHAPKRTKDAADVLGHGLAAALPPSPNKMPGIIKEDFTKSTVARGFMPKDAPWAIVAFDPDLITVVIGEHP